MIKNSTTSTFGDGMVLDLNPISTPNNVLTNCLNGTLITFNGNEGVLQNDMGNGRVETAFLPEGYIPLGTTQLGGIIYIVSYNPLIDKCQIGSFPSPERNITNDELSPPNNCLFQVEDFIKDNKIIALYVKKKLSDVILHSGDKFIVCGDNIANNITNDTATSITYIDENGDIKYCNINFRIAIIDNNGRIIYLEDLIKREINTGKYHYIANGIAESVDADIDEYRKAVSSNYNIFTSKIAGELYIVGELELIDTFTVTWKYTGINENKYNIQFNITTTSDKNKYLKYVELTTELTKETIEEPTKEYEYYIKDDNDKDGNYTINCPIPTDVEKAKFTFIPYMNFGKIPQMETTIEIDTSLFGSEELNNNIWQYYKNDNSMNLSFNLISYLPETIVTEDIKIYCIPYNELVEGEDPSIKGRTPIYTINKRKSYSGNYHIIIPFNEILEPNNLYLIIFQQNNRDEQNNLTSHYLHKVLYTNGVFNQQYIDKRELDFDKVQLDLNFKLKSNIVQKNITTSQKEQIDGSYVVLTGTADNVKGTIKTTLNGKVDVDLQLHPENDFFNTFLVDSNIICSKNDVTPYLSYEAHKVQTNLDFDDDFVAINQNVDEEGKVIGKEDEEDEKDYYTTNITQSGNKLTITLNGDFYNRISANHTNKNVTVQNYYAPLLQSSNDLQKYGFKSINNDISLDLSLGLGMSNGGTDNQGGGGIYHVNGRVDPYWENYQINFRDNTAIGLQDSAGDPGYDIFPNNDFSSFISQQSADVSIVPIVLINAGTNHFTYNGEGKNFRFDSNDDKSKAKKRKEWFENASPTNLLTIWLFIKGNNESVYYPLNNFFQVKGSSFNLYKQTALHSDTFNSVGYTFKDLLLSFLLQTYVRKIYNTSIQAQSVNDIVYFDNVTEKLKIKFKYSYKVNDTHLIFINKKIEDIKKAFPDTVDKTCFTYKINDGSEYSTVDININLKNTLLDTYLKYQGSEITLDNYVESGIYSDNITIQDKVKENSLYYVNNNKLVDFNAGTNFKIINNISINSTNSFTGTISNTLVYCSSNIPSFLKYDNRNDYLTISKDGYNNSRGVQGRWGSHKSEKDGNWTSWKDISIFKKFKPDEK